MEMVPKICLQIKTLQNSHPRQAAASLTPPIILQLLFNSPSLTFDQEANCEVEQHHYGMLPAVLSMDLTNN